jgi:hypothetical protein
MTDVLLANTSMPPFQGSPSFPLLVPCTLVPLDTFLLQAPSPLFSLHRSNSSLASPFPSFSDFELGGPFLLLQPHRWLTFDARLSFATVCGIQPLELPGSSWRGDDRKR